MRSIKKQILIFIFIIMCVNTIVIAFATYFELKHEMDDFFDENIKQLAHAIAVNDLSEESQFIEKEHISGQTVRGEDEFLIQIWNKGVLSYSSFPSLALPQQQEGGVETVFFDQQEWRYYALAQDNWLIQVSQPIPVRHTVIWDVYWEILVLILIQFPLLVGVIWFLIGYGFKPLQKISASIGRRNANFLGKISLDDAPQEVRAMIDALNSLLERLDRTLKAQREFTADAAHELRSPLTALSLQLDMLRRAKTEKEKVEAIDALYRGVDRSTHLVQQLLELARQEPDGLQNVTEACTLHDILKKVYQQYEALARSKAIDFKMVQLDNAFIQGDENSLQVMIGNLVNNAILYTQHGGKVELLLRNSKEGVQISVADNGAGIPEEEKQRIFDRFYRIVGTKATGSGLGLYIVKTIAVRHNARIEVAEGLDNIGTTFTVIFNREKRS